MDFVPEYNPDVLRQKALRQERITKPLFKKLKKQKPKSLDEVVNELHDEVFRQIDCLACANCCRSLGPRLTDRDIRRLSKHLRMKKDEFADTYLQTDEDGDYVFKSMPCPFLIEETNECFVYEHRPKACREYPHTDRKNYYQILHLGIKNAYYCPAVLYINDALIKRYGLGG